MKYTVEFKRLNLYTVMILLLKLNSPETRMEQSDKKYTAVEEKGRHFATS